MFLHLGNGISVKTSDIIAIQDFALFKNGPGNDFFYKQQKRTKLINTLSLNQRQESSEAVKSVIITTDKMYLSAISPLTLKRRSQFSYYTAAGL